MTKCIRDGKVAILYSPGYGARWSTWNDEKFKKFLLHDEELVKLVETNQRDKIEEYVESVFPGEYICVLGEKNLKIEWVSQGTQFYIREYDGCESIVFNYDDYWEVA
jgi:hypothetical protein